MPTGYTAKLMESGEDFKSFALRCARAFGACLDMRDDNMETPIPEKFYPSDYYAKALPKAQKQLRKLSRMTPAQQLAFGANEKKRSVALHRKWEAERKEQDARLQSMVDEVQKWTPPSSEHLRFRDFMLEQLGISKNGSHWSELVAKNEAKSEMEFYDEALEKAAREVSHYRKEMKKEKERCAQKNKWISLLRESLK